MISSIYWFFNIAILALPAPDPQRSASREQAHVAVNRDVAVENRATAAPIAIVRAAVPHSALDSRESSTPDRGWRARPHDSQRYRQLLAFGLPDRRRTEGAIRANDRNSSPLGRFVRRVRVCE